MRKLKQPILQAISGISLTAMILVLSACNQKTKTPLTGERINIMPTEEVITLDPRLANYPVRLSPALANSDWSQQYAGPAHLLAPAHLAQTTQLKKTWSTRVSGNTTDSIITSTPIIANNQMYVLDGASNLIVLNPQNGKKVATIKLLKHPTRSIGGGVAYSKGIIFATVSLGHVYAIDEKTHKVLWEQKLHAPLRAAPTVIGNLLLVLDLDNTLHAMDANTGEHLWNHIGVPEVSMIVGGSSPAATSQIVVVGYTAGEVYGLNPQSGAVLWSHTLSNDKANNSLSEINHIRAHPVIDGNTSVILSNSGKMIVVNNATGQVMWSRNLGGGSTPAVNGEFIFLHNRDDQLLAIHKITGGIKWARSLPRDLKKANNEQYVSWSGPIMVNNELITVNSKGVVLFVDPNSGELLRHLELHHPCFVPPIAANGKLYFLGSNGTISAWQ